MIRILIGCLLLLALSNGHTTAQLSLNTQKDEQRYHHLINELRCMVCQNQSIAESNADLAKDLRQQVAVMINLGRDDEFIRDYMTERYGDYIRYKPPMTATTLALWTVPPLLVIMVFLRVWHLNSKHVAMSVGNQLDGDAVRDMSNTTLPWSRTPTALLMIGVGMLVAMSSITIYLLLGDPDAPAKIAWQQQLVTAKTRIPILINALQQQPDDKAAWLELVSNYQTLRQDKEAVSVLAKLRIIAPDDIDISLNYAQALIALRQGDTSGQPANLIQQILRRAPDNTTALRLGILASLDRAEFLEAESLLSHLRQIETVTHAEVQHHSYLATEIQSRRQQTDSVVRIHVNVNPELLKSLPSTHRLIVGRKTSEASAFEPLLVRSLDDLPLSLLLKPEQIFPRSDSVNGAKDVTIVVIINPSDNPELSKGSLFGQTSVQSMPGLTNAFIHIKSQQP